VCKGAAVTLNAPFTGNAGVILTIGTDKKRYCASFGGDEVDNASGTLIRKKADAPLACPGAPPPPPSPCACGTPDPGMLSFRTTVGSGPCGVVIDNSCASQKTLDTNTLYIGGGNTAQPPSSVPDYGQTVYKVTSCDGKTLTLGNTTSGDTGSNLNCSSTGCLYGAPLPIPNANAVALSTCVINSLSANGSGSAQCDTGASATDIPLDSAPFLTGDLLDGSAANRPAVAGIQPCPLCNAGPPPGGTCAAANCCWGGPNHDLPCTPGTIASTGAEFPTSHDCPPPGSPIGHLPIAYALTTGTSNKNASDLSSQNNVFCGFCANAAGTAWHNPAVACTADTDCTGQTGCPGATACGKCKQRTQGAFDVGLARFVRETGTPAGPIATNDPAKPATVVSVFCIPPAFNGAVDATADLPGPGAVCLNGETQLLP